VCARARTRAFAHVARSRHSCIERRRYKYRARARARTRGTCNEPVNLALPLSLSRLFRTCSPRSSIARRCHSRDFYLFTEYIPRFNLVHMHVRSAGYSFVCPFYSPFFYARSSRRDGVVSWGTSSDRATPLPRFSPAIYYAQRSVKKCRVENRGGYRKKSRPSENPESRTKVTERVP